jgi:hypothetical protein
MPPNQNARTGTDIPAGGQHTGSIKKIWRTISKSSGKAKFLIKSKSSYG